MNWKIIVPVAAVVLGVVGAVVYWLTPDIVDPRVELLPVHPANWDELEVAVWLNSTVKYPEYHKAFKTHSVDGPTLFYLTENDLKFLGVKNPVHRAKLLAHLDILRGKCLCTPRTLPDFWDYAGKHTYKVLYLGALFEWAPRVGFAYSLFFASETVASALAFFGATSWPYVVYPSAVVVFLLAPHLGLMFISATLLLPSNYILFLCYLLAHYNKLVVDFVELRELLPELKERRTLQMLYNLLFNMRASRTAWLKEMLYPIVFIVLGPFLPYLLVQIVLYVYFGSFIFSYGVFLVDAVIKYTQKGEGEAGAPQ